MAALDKLACGRRCVHLPYVIIRRISTETGYHRLVYTSQEHGLPFTLSYIVSMRWLIETVIIHSTLMSIENASTSTDQV